MSTSNVRRRFENILFLSSLGTLAGILFVVVGHLAENISMALARPEKALTYTGGIMAALARNPDQLYSSMQAPPFLPTIYPPLYPRLINEWHQLLGLPIPLVQRLMGLYSVIGGAIAVGLIVEHYTEHWPAAVASGGLWLLSPAVSRATVLARVDVLAMLVGFAALAHAVKGSSDWRWAALFTVGALFVKHSLIAIPATIMLTYAYHRDWHSLVRYSVATGLLGLSGLAALAVATGGRALEQMFLYNMVQPFSVGRLVGQLVWLSWIHLPLLVVAGCVLLYYGREVPAMPAILTMVGFLTAVFTLGKLGSWIGYAYPLIAGACMVLGWFVAQHVPDTWRAFGKVDHVAMTSVVMLLLAAQLGLYATWPPSTPTHHDNQELTEAYIAGSGEVLSIDPSIDHDGNVYGVFVMEHVRESGLWQDRVTPRIEAREYDHIVLWHNAESAETGRWGPKQMQAVTENYEQVEQFGRYRIYAPKGEE